MPDNPPGNTSDPPGHRNAPPGPGPGRRDDTAPTTPGLSIYEKNRHLDKLAKAMLASQGIVAGSAPNRLLQVMYHAPLYPPAQALALRESAKFNPGPREVIPPNTIRFNFPMRDFNSLPRDTVRTDLLRYYNPGRPCFIPVTPLGPELDEIRPLVQAASHRVTGGRNDRTGDNRPVVHQHDLHFASRKDMDDALAKAPYVYANKDIHCQSETMNVNDVFEFRFLYSGTDLEADTIRETMLDALKVVEMDKEVLQIQRVLHTSAPSCPRDFTFIGEYNVHVQIPRLASHVHRGRIFALFPTHITLGDTGTRNLYHAYRACTKCNSAEHTAAACKVPTASTTEQPAQPTASGSGSRPVTASNSITLNGNRYEAAREGPAVTAPTAAASEKPAARLDDDEVMSAEGESGDLQGDAAGRGLGADAAVPEDDDTAMQEDNELAATEVEDDEASSESDETQANGARPATPVQGGVPTTTPRTSPPPTPRTAATRAQEKLNKEKRKQATDEARGKGKGKRNA